MKKPVKKCVVPICTNNTINSPKKNFLYAPADPARRSNWLKALNLNDIPYHSYVCEDHFILEEDMENYIRYQFMGGCIKLKPGVVPHVFECQEDRKRAASPILESGPSTRQEVHYIEKFLIQDAKRKKYSYQVKSEIVEPVQTKSVGVQVKPLYRSKYVICKIRPIMRDIGTST